MDKKIKLTESNLKALIENTVRRVLKESLYEDGSENIEGQGSGPRFKEGDYVVVQLNYLNHPSYGVVLEDVPGWGINFDILAECEKNRKQVMVWNTKMYDFIDDVRLMTDAEKDEFVKKLVFGPYKNSNKLSNWLTKQYKKLKDTDPEHPISRYVGIQKKEHKEYLKREEEELRKNGWM